MVPNSIFSIFGQPVYLYGICIGVGIIVCLIVFYFYTKKSGMTEAVQDFCFICAFVAIIIGFIFAKLYQAVYDWIAKGYFDFKNAGITAMGGFIGGALAFILTYFLGGKIWLKKSNALNLYGDFNTVFRTAPICIVIAHAFGRIGCLFGGCCHGAYLGPNPVTGGIYMKGTVDGVSKWGYYVPTQLYESIFLFVLFGVLSYLYLKRKSNITMIIYLIAYGVWRFIIEFFRGDEARGKWGGLYFSQWQSFIFILGGIAILVFYIIKKKPFELKAKPDKPEAEAQ